MQLGDSPLFVEVTMEYEYKLSEAYANIAHEVINTVPELEYLKEAPVSIGYMASDYKKKSKKRLVFGECVKVKDMYKAFVPFDFLIIIYDPNAELLNENQLRILIEHELLHIQIENQDDINPVYSINPHDIEDFRSIVEKYGIDWADDI